MDKNTWIGFLLIAAIIVGFSMLNRPSKEQLAEQQRINDSIAYARQLALEAQQISEAIDNELKAEQQASQAATEEQVRAQVVAAYGPLAPAAIGEEKEVVLENELVKLYLSTKGGRMVRAELKNYKAYGDTVNNLTLFRADESAMSFTLVTNNQRVIATKNLYFEAIRKADNEVIMRLKTSEEDAWLDFVYRLEPEQYMSDFLIEAHNMQLVLAQNVNSMELQWAQRISQQERGRKFEERYARLQYMLVGGDMEELSESKADGQKESGRVKWIAYKDQFFSTVLISEDGFTGSAFESNPLNSSYIKEYSTITSVPLDLTGSKATVFHIYTGPNHYNILKAYDADRPSVDKWHLKELVPLGWKIVAWINKIIVIPLFDLFMGWKLHIGIVILLLTLVIKLIILPFVFASYRSSAKMRVLKPQLDAINEQYPAEKMQERQQATMALYRRAGVSPMSGCLPMLFQFPVLMAMFWFLPTAIELRGQSLWWAEDLSTYDAILSWGFHLPLLGDHLSLFCLLMTVANFGYTFITMQQQNTDPNMKFMKYMMYLMPLMFLFIFNDYAAGLSYYYLLSLGITILQTMIFRWSIDDKKLLAEMEANARKKDSKPKSGFMARLEQMQREQQKMMREQAKANAKRYR